VIVLQLPLNFTRWKIIGAGLGAGFGMIVWPQTAWAIPSPELVVGTLSSLSQLVALASAVIGGGAVAAGNRSRARAQSKVPGRALMVFAAAFLVSLVLNAVQYDWAVNERTQRLEATLQRPAPKTADGQPLDPSLKELTFKEQSGHPLAVETAEAKTLVEGVASGALQEWQIVDIRETAETESGSLPNAKKIRFPDLSTSNLDLISKKTLFICHNGNRSAETCLKLAERGIDCRFIAGGLEKWLTEGFPLEGLAARTVDELRKIPDYPNHQTLLDTPEVEVLVAEQNIVFVDVRYPGEFAASHIAGAINIPLRPTPTADVKKRLADIPKRPVVAPCYDRRSCFFAEILGLELTRAGHDFRGRYTVPWEYFVPGKKPPHVEAFLAEANMSLWQRGARARHSVRDASRGYRAAMGVVRVGVDCSIDYFAICTEV
jgi:rifampicin phosphotransferase